MQDSRTTEMLKRVQEVNNKIESGEIKISDMKAEPLPLMNQEGNLSHVSDVVRRKKTCKKHMYYIRKSNGKYQCCDCGCECDKLPCGYNLMF